MVVSPEKFHGQQHHAVGMDGVGVWLVTLARRPRTCIVLSYCVGCGLWLLAWLVLLTLIGPVSLYLDPHQRGLSQFHQRKPGRLKLNYHFIFMNFSKLLACSCWVCEWCVYECATKILRGYLSLSTRTCHVHVLRVTTTVAWSCDLVFNFREWKCLHELALVASPLSGAQ